MEDMQTAGSDTFAFKDSTENDYIEELASELVKATSSFRTDSLSMRRIADAMPDCLRAFSSRLSSLDSSQGVDRNVPTFIRKYRQ
jgi:hypothetical protein